LTEQPSLTLNFYSFGVMLHKRDGERVSEYAVDPAQVALALSSKVRFDTGFLSGDTLLVRQEGVRKTVVEYREPQKVGIYLEGSDTALRIPMIGLVMIRLTSDNRQPDYGVYAVKKRPSSLDEPLFYAPLPNVYASGAICWGTVQRVTDSAIAGTSLAEDWGQLFGSPFGNHSTGGKSKKHPGDIRQMLIDLNTRKVRAYPKSDLQPVKKTLAQVLKDDK
jgi:hypothetical protein